MEIMVEFVLFAREFPLDKVYEKIGIEKGEKERLEEADFQR